MADLITRTAKRYYEEVYLQNIGAQFFNKIFGIPDESTTAAFTLDKFTSSPFALTYRQKDGQSRVTQYTAGSSTTVEPPIASRKTPLSEDILDSVAAGVEADGGYGPNEAQQVNQILRDHVGGLNMLKNKQAIDVLQYGYFYALGPEGADVGLNITFGRDAGNSLTYDFTDAAATITAAFVEAQAQMIAMGTPYQDQVVVLGSDWQTEFTTDATVLAFMQNNAMNQLMVAQMAPPELLGIEGLFVLGQYRSAGMLAPLWVTAYAPPIAYVKDEGETSEPYVPTTNAIFFSLADTRYKINRGVNALDDMGQRVRLVGDLVIDRYSENDPVTEFIRTSTRHCFVPANIDHTVYTVGTFT